MKDLGVDGRITLKYVLNKEDGMVWAGFMWFTTHTHMQQSSILYKIRKLGAK